MEQYDILADLAEVDLGDSRRDSRLTTIARKLGANPALSLPDIFSDPSALAATYRLLATPSVTDQRILAPHFARTASRCGHAEDVLVLHDTSEASFTAVSGLSRTNLAQLSSQRQGFQFHASLAVSDEAVSIPLGLLAVLPYVHASQVGPDVSTWWAERDGILPNEHRRWLDGCVLAESRLADMPVDKVIHVCDREGDSTELLTGLVERGSRFVIRCTHLHRVCRDSDDMKTTVATVVGSQSAGAESRRILVRSESLTAARKKGKAKPDGERRMAKVQVRWCSVTLPPASASKGQPARLFAVDLFEDAPPAGVKPARWTLYTSEPITTEEDAWRCVDRYRKRWLIEEFFKAVKTGVAFETRQLESATGLLNLFALSALVAIQMLMLRAFERAIPEAEASELFEPAAIRLLAALVPSAKLTRRASLGQVLRAIATYGGHLKNNGPPGWLTLHRGYRKLLHALEVQAALAAAATSENQGFELESEDV